MTKFTSLLFFVSILHFSCITEQLRESAYLKIKEDKVKLSYQIPERGYMKFVLEPSQVGIENKDVMVKVTNEVDEFLIPIHTNFDMNKIFEIELNSHKKARKINHEETSKKIKDEEVFEYAMNYQIKQPVFYLQLQDRIGNILLDKVEFNYKTKDESAFWEAQKVYIREYCEYRGETQELKSMSREEVRNKLKTHFFTKEEVEKMYKRYNIPDGKKDLFYNKLLLTFETEAEFYCRIKEFGYKIPKE